MKAIWLLALSLMLARPLVALGPVVITEFMAANGAGLRDEDGDASDWLELQNISATAVNLGGWHLTDDAEALTRWTFPSVTLGPGGYLVVFASGKDRAVAGAPLHTSFQLEREGEFLALVQPDGVTIAHAFAPKFPDQDSGISYGVTVSLETIRFITNGGPVKWRVPSEPSELPPEWASTNFDETMWAAGFLGLGFDADGLFAPFVATSLRDAMRGLNATAGVRATFMHDAEEFEPSETLALRVRYDDGFVAYLNGVEVARRNAPAALGWNSAATNARSDAAAVVAEAIDISAARSLLQSGPNVLAVQVLNASAADDDLLLTVELEGQRPRLTERYFATPTPGTANAAAYLGRVPEVKFSAGRGFYDAPFELSLSNGTPGVTIRYTLDGSAPGPATGLVYSGPFRVERTTVVRAAAFKPGYQASEIDTRTYIFLDDILRQSSASALSNGFPATIAGLIPDYEMDRKVIGPGDNFGGRYAASIREDLKSLASVSLVFNRADVFGTNSLLANSMGHGQAWERPASVELFGPDGEESEQVDAGLRLNGHLSRQIGLTWKPSFRLLFKERYGPAQWHYPVFGTYSNATDNFDTLILRAGSQDSWSFGLNIQQALYTRDAFMRETMLAMQATASHQRYVHLYLNGLYWGVYELLERPDAAFSSAYYGGEKEEWASVQSGFPASGDFEVWDRLLAQCRAGLGNNDSYLALQGRNSDGTPNPASTNHLDVDNLIDYMIAHLYAMNQDWPGNNYWLGRQRAAPSSGFKFYPWDAEFSMDMGPVTLNLTSVSWGVAEPFAACRQNLEFRVAFGDRVQAHFFNGGALHTDPFNPRWSPVQPERNLAAARFVRLCDSLRSAIVAESARWGDAHSTLPMTRDEQWAAREQYVLTNFFPQRSAIVLQQFRALGLFPTLAAPTFSPPGGLVPDGFTVTLFNPNTTGGAIFYTLDGSDPRLVGGAIHPAAVAYAEPEILNRVMEVRARVRQGTNWSALARATYYPPQDFTKLQVTELMYHPPSFGNVDGDELEFLELKNTGTNALRLDGLRFDAGIDFTFTNGTTLRAGEFFLLVRNMAQFAARYPGVPSQGVYSGKLDNSGEILRLVHPLGSPVFLLSYADRAPWPVAADGLGFSIVPAQSGDTSSLDVGASWRASASPGGSPGRDDPPSGIVPVVINEVLAASVFPGLDAIELFNPGPVAAAIGGWFLTDDPTVPKKFRIPEGTVLAAGGFMVFDEAQFNAAAGGTNRFALRAEGDEVYLFSAAGGVLTGYTHGFRFGASERGVTFGRVVQSSGDDELAWQLGSSLGRANAGPGLGPVVFNEIHYHPDANGDEFIELRNITGEPVRLFDILAPTHTWRINGLGFAFPEQVTLAPQGLLLIVLLDPTVFRQKYGVPAAVPIFGPYAGQLQDSGERLELQRPEPVDTNSALSFVDVDVVRYDDRAPWPPAADGAGPSLQRKSPLGFGNDAVAWEAAALSPGRVFTEGVAPLLIKQPGSVMTLTTRDVSFSVEASGQPPLFYQWIFNGAPLAHATNATLLLSNVSIAQSGTYLVVVFNDAGVVFSEPATLTARTGADIYSAPSNVWVHIRPDPRAAPVTNATFWVGAASSTPLRYQWRFNGADIVAATNTTLVVSNVQLADEGLYSAAVSDAYGTVFSRGGYLQPFISPTFVQQPLGQAAAAGSAVTLSAAVDGHPGPFSFVWRLGGRPVLTNAALGNFDFFTFHATNLPINQNAAVVARSPANPFPGVISSNAVIVTLPDMDGDGIPDEWEIRFGANPTNAADRITDSDGDGMSNWEEYLAGTEPTNAMSWLRVELSADGGSPRIQFIALSNRTYSVLWSDNERAAWNKLADVLARPSNRLETVVDMEWPTNRFYRISTPRTP